VLEEAGEAETGDFDFRQNTQADLKAGFSYILSIPANPRCERKPSDLVTHQKYGDKARVVPARMFKIRARSA